MDGVVEMVIFSEWEVALIPEHCLVLLLASHVCIRATVHIEMK